MGAMTAQVLERGNIYFVYRPKLDEPSPDRLEEVQRFYMILKPHGKEVYRLIVLGQKQLPEVKEAGHRVWGFVDKVGRKPQEVEDELEREKYPTKTRGERERPAVRPAGEGAYVLARHNDHTHLAYALELPEKPGEVQKEFHIEEEGSYVLTVKNPEQPTPPGVGLEEERKVDFPKRLQERFKGRRFIEVDPPDLLDCEGAEVLLVGSAEDVSAELGIKLDPQRETAETAEIFNDLRLEKSQHPTEPLFRGEWR